MESQYLSKEENVTARTESQDCHYYAWYDIWSEPPKLTNKREPRTDMTGPPKVFHGGEEFEPLKYGADRVRSGFDRGLARSHIFSRLFLNLLMVQLTVMNYEGLREWSIWPMDLTISKYCVLSSGALLVGALAVETKHPKIVKAYCLSHGYVSSLFLVALAFLIVPGGTPKSISWFNPIMFQGEMAELCTALDATLGSDLSWIEECSHNMTIMQRFLAGLGLYLVAAEMLILRYCYWEWACWLEEKRRGDAKTADVEMVVDPFEKQALGSERPMLVEKK